VADFFKPVVLACAAGVLAGCAYGTYDTIELMPSPVVYSTGEFDPFPDFDDEDFVAQTQLLYVTDRAPAGPEDWQPRYTYERGLLMRAGTADVALHPQVDEWQEARDITLSGKRDQVYTLSVSETEEIGILPSDVVQFLEEPPDESEMDAASRAFAEEINRQVAYSETKDVFIFVHGYKNDFEYPVLVAKELQHFLGYQGAFIGFGWPATPHRFAYFRDVETAAATVRNLRTLVEFLSEETEAERINLIGFSAGSRLVFEATKQIALMNKASGDNGAYTPPRLGEVILIGSDVDRANFGQALLDGILDASDRLTVYMSGSDSALDFSSLLSWREQRVGQIWTREEITPVLEQRILAFETLALIDVSAADAADAGSGHSYFRTSPWASSDLIVLLLYGLSPEDRGLIREPGYPIWQFPSDYPARITATVAELERSAKADLTP